MHLLSLIEGFPGSGKTYSCRNLGSETLFLDTERKALPFKNNGIVKAQVKTVDEMTKYLKTLATHPDYVDKYKVLVIDSFSEFSNRLMTECKAKYKGFEQFSQYNQGIANFFDLLKDLPMYVFAFGHTEQLKDDEGEAIYRMKVHGKQFEQMIEAQATCVFCTKIKRKETGQGVEHWFQTNSDSILPAKSPAGMFPFLIENDIAQIVKVYDKFYS